MPTFKITFQNKYGNRQSVEIEARDQAQAMMRFDFDVREYQWVYNVEDITSEPPEVDDCESIDDFFPDLK